MIIALDIINQQNTALDERRYFACLHVYFGTLREERDPLQINES